MRATKTKVLAKRALMFAALAPLVFQAARAQSKGSTSTAAKSDAAGATEDGTKSGAPDVAKTLKAAAEAVGLARWSGVGGQRLPEVDVINTMEVWASGTCYDLGPSKKPGEVGSAFKAEYHVALGYNPPAMRVELTRTGSGAAKEHTIEVVRDKYAWDESELGAGLIPGKGTATPAMGAVNKRLLELWLLPYGVIKAALMAGDRTKLSTENGAAVLTFPLSGPLADLTVKATLDAQNEVAKVETRSDNPAFSGLLTEVQYSDYKDHGEIATDVKSPGHIVRKQGGHPVLDIQVKTWDANNPYLVFPVPENVKQAASH